MTTSNFNMDNFLREYRNYNNKQYTAAENAKAAMEERDISRAEEAVKNNNLLSLTLSEKMTELGIGKRVLQQITDTAIGAVEEVISPLTDWLEKYENIFDEKVYNAELQAIGKQFFFNEQARAAEAAKSPNGQNFNAYY